RIERALDACLVHAAARSNLAPQPAQYFLIEDGRETPHCAFIDHQPNRVGADIDDPYRLELAPGLEQYVIPHHEPDVSADAPSGRPNRRGKFSFKDCPRPERLGLVIKYSCALNGSSPSAGEMRSEEPSASTRQLCWLSLMLATMIWPRICS